MSTIQNKSNVRIEVRHMSRNKYDVNLKHLTRDQCLMLAEILECGEAAVDVHEPVYYENADLAQALIDKAILVQVVSTVLEEVQ